MTSRTRSGLPHGPERISRLTVALLCATIGLMCSACGGGGSGSPAPAAFAGTYRMIRMFGSHNGGKALEVHYGTATSDGAGAISLTWDSKQQGQVILGTSETLGYTIGADSSLVLTFGTSPLYRGGLQANNARAVLSSVGPATRPSMIVLLREAGAHNDVLLDQWGVFGFGQDPSSGDIGCLFGDMQPTSIGQNTAMIESNTEGMIAFGSVPVGIGIDPSHPTISFIGEELRGQVDAARTTATFGGATQNTGTTYGMLMMRTKPAVIADYQGTWWTSSFEYHASRAEFGCSNGSATIDASGAITVVGDVNRELTGLSEAVTGTATMTAGSPITVSRSGVTETLRATMGIAGDMFVAVGGTQNTQTQILWVFVRQ